MNIKNIYKINTALVRDDVINLSNDDINDILPNSDPGMVIYTAGYKMIKQKSLTGEWVDVNVNNWRFLNNTVKQEIRM